jgi:uncharacterized membrane protein
LPSLLVDRNLNTHAWPYKSDANSVEYPPGTAMVMWLTSFAIDHNYNQYRDYFDVNAILIFILFIFTIILLKKMSPKYWYLSALAPAAIASLFINWDIWAVLPALLSIYWFDNKKYEKSALALGISIATKFFPIVLLIPATIILVKHKSNWLKYNLIAVGSWILLNLPFAITTPKGWWRFYKLNINRGLDWGSIWQALDYLGIKSKGLNFLSTFTFVIGAIAYAIYLWRKKFTPTLAVASFYIVALFVTASKVYSPQYVLWITPLAVLLLSDRTKKAFWIWQGCELLYHFAIWQYLANVTGTHFSISEKQYALATLIRVAGLAYFSISALRSESTVK